VFPTQAAPPEQLAFTQQARPGAPQLELSTDAFTVT
jgi:hypothetical protein